MLHRTTLPNGYSPTRVQIAGLQRMSFMSQVHRLPWTCLLQTVYHLPYVLGE